MTTNRELRGQQNVLLVINRIDDEAGGSLRAALNTAEALLVAGSRVCLVAPLGSDVANTSAVASLEASGLIVHKFHASTPTARFGVSMSLITWLRRHLTDFDAVHIHGIFHAAAIFSAWQAAHSGVRYYVWPHGSLGSYDLRKHRAAKSILAPITFRPMLARASGVLCTTERERVGLNSFGAVVKPLVIPLPVSLPDTPASLRIPWRAKHGVPQEAFTILFLGRIDEKKRLDRVVDALQTPQLRECTLLVAGASPNEPESLPIVELARARNVSNQIQFLGWLEGEDRIGVLAASDAFILPSEDENFGIAVVESMLANLPVIITRQIYLSEELEANDVVWLVDGGPGSIADAVAAIRDASPSAKAAKLQRAHQYASEHFSTGKIGAALAAL